MTGGVGKEWEGLWRRYKGLEGGLAEQAVQEVRVQPGVADHVGVALGFC
jgi:hypothetical protein